MKKKLFLLLCALLTMIGVQAQSYVDITSKYLTNPSFETGDMTGWTAFGDNENTPVPTAALVSEKPLANAAGERVCNYQWWCWSANGSKPNGISQTISQLPAGTYKLTAIVGSPISSPYTEDAIEKTCTWTTTLYANEESASTTMASDYKGKQLSVTFTLSEASDVTVKAILTGSANKWLECNMRVDNFKLYRLATDVTNTYLTNADFSTTAGWDNHSGGGSEHSEGFGKIGTLELNGKKSTTDATHLATEYCCGLSARWNGRFTYYQQTAQNLIPGSYTLSYDVEDVNSTSTKYNMDNYFYVQVGETKHLDTQTEWMDAGASSWTKHSITFVLTETSDATISFGYGNKENKGTGDCPAIYVSHLKLTHIDAATAYAAAVTSATATYNDATYANVTGTEKTALYNAIHPTSEPSIEEAYFTAINNINTAVDNFTGAKPSYDKFDVEKESAIAIGVAAGDIVRPTSASANDLQNAINALYVLEDAAATSGYEVDATTLFGTWTTQNLDTKSGQHWSDNASISYYDKWSASGYTSSITSTVTLPAGKYVFKLAARAQSGSINGAFNMSVQVGSAGAVYKDFVAKNDTGKGIDTSGKANYGDGTFANSNNGRGWEWRFIGFELDEEASVTMKGYAQIYGKNWVGFTDATLLTTSDNVGVLKNLLNEEITAATSLYNSGANVGTGVFQITEKAGDDFVAAIATAQAVYDDGDATSSDVSDAIDALKTAEETFVSTLNAPDSEKRYCIIVATTGHAKEGEAFGIALGATSANNPTGYTVNTGNTTNQSVAFTQVSGNIYNISYETAAGTTYLTYGTTNGSKAGWSDSQIQATTDAEKKGQFKIVATSTANKFNIYNTLTNSTIACQSGGNIYTEPGNADFSVSEAVSANLTVSNGKLGTFIAPFDVVLPTGVKAYSATSDTEKVTLTKKYEGGEKLPAGTPVIIYGDGVNVNDNFEGYSCIAGNKTVGALTGMLVDKTVPADAYVLQTQGGIQAFYQLEKSATASFNRCYVTANSVGAEARLAIVFEDDDPTAISAIEAAESEAGALKDGKYLIDGKIVIVKNGVKYDANGKKLN